MKQLNPMHVLGSTGVWVVGLFALAIISIPIGYFIALITLAFLPLITLATFFLSILNKQEQQARASTVVIVEDDEDIAKLLMAQLKNLGIKSKWFKWEEPLSNLFSDPIGYIILDWKLGIGREGSELLKKASYFVSKTFPLQGPLRVITFSSLNRGEICFPSSNIFQHFGHWNKQISANALVTNLNQLAASIH